jgi:hypothetical protein
VITVDDLQTLDFTFGYLYPEGEEEKENAGSGSGSSSSSGSNSSIAPALTAAVATSSSSSSSSTSNPASSSNLLRAVTEAVLIAAGGKRFSKPSKHKMSDSERAEKAAKAAQIEAEHNKSIPVHIAKSINDQVFY